ncbi:hypothetical protein KJ590_00140 [Patescibacteria group bacterium]|nr:hypothetical protein [Patescibacteria group bacterium]
MTTKRILTIAIILLVLSLGSLLIYNFFFKPTAPGQGTETGNGLPSALPGTGQTTNGSSFLPGTGGAGQTGQSPSATAQKIKPISQEPVLAPTIGEDGQTVKYYTRSNGHVWESDFVGANLKKLSAVTLNGLIKAIWSPDKTKVIGWFSDNNKIKKYFYDYAKNQSSLLAEKMGWVTFSPDSKHIAYLFVDAATGQNDVSVANPDGSNWKNIFKTRLDNLIVAWPSAAKISLGQPASGLAQSILYSLNPDSGDFSKILSDIFGLSVKWSPKADKILYSSTSDRGQNPKLALADATGANGKDLKLAGLADKCVWSKDDRTIFCALPQELSPNAVWPDDYYKGLVILADDFYKINLETDEKIKLLGSTSQFSYDAQELFLSPKEDYLFFVNRRDGLLWSLKIQ